MSPAPFFVHAPTLNLSKMANGESWNTTDPVQAMTLFFEFVQSYQFVAPSSPARSPDRQLVEPRKRFFAMGYPTTATTRKTNPINLEM